MKKSGCVIIALFVALCVSMFVNLLLFAALVGMRGSSNVTASEFFVRRSLRKFSSRTAQLRADCGYSFGGHYRLQPIR